MEARTGKPYDAMIDLDITSPLRTEQDIENAFAKAQEREDLQIIFSVCEARRNPWFNMFKIVGDHAEIDVYKRQRPSWPDRPSRRGGSPPAAAKSRSLRKRWPPTWACPCLLYTSVLHSVLLLLCCGASRTPPPYKFSVTHIIANPPQKSRPKAFLKGREAFFPLTKRPRCTTIILYIK